jgi:hypothetical protein
MRALGFLRCCIMGAFLAGTLPAQEPQRVSESAAYWNQLTARLTTLRKSVGELSTRTEQSESARLSFDTLGREFVFLRALAPGFIKALFDPLPAEVRRELGCEAGEDDPRDCDEIVQLFAERIDWTPPDSSWNSLAFGDRSRAVRSGATPIYQLPVSAGSTTARWAHPKCTVRNGRKEYTIYYHDEALRQFSIDALRFLRLHELAHVVLGHIPCDGTDAPTTAAKELDADCLAHAWIGRNADQSSWARGAFAQVIYFKGSSKPELYGLATDRIMRVRSGRGCPPRLTLLANVNAVQSFGWWTLPSTDSLRARGKTLTLADSILAARLPFAQLVPRPQ